MRATALCLCTFLVTTALPAGASAQSIVDLSKPQTGKSRFVLNADMTPADLGKGEAPQPMPAAAAAPRAPACGEGCKLEQTDAPPTAHESRRAFRPVPGLAQSGAAGTYVMAVGGTIARQTEESRTRRKTFQFRRR